MINSFFLNWDEQEAAKLVKGKLQAVLDFANNLLTSTDFAMIGEKIGKFLSELKLSDYADDIALLIKNLIQAAFVAYGKIAEEAPIETALLTAFGLWKFNGLSVIGGNMATGLMGGFSSKIVGLMTTDLAVLASSGSLAASAAAVGLAIGGSILAAIGGLNLGIEIGKMIFPDDEMWYDQFKSELQEYFSYRFNTGTVKVEGGGKPITGHAKQENNRTRYDANTFGKDINGIIDAQLESQRQLEEEQRKAEALANSAVTRYTQAVTNHNAAVSHAISSNQRVQLAISNGAMTVEEATEAYENMHHATVYVRKDASDLTKETSNAKNATNELVKALGSSNAAMTGGVFTGEARKMANLNTTLLTTKAGLERISTIMDEIGNKKDKTNNLKDSFDGIKGKVEEIGTLFSFDRMSDIFSSIPDAFLYAWKDALNVMKIMWTELANWINANAKIEIPKTKVGNQEIGGKTVQLKVPRFDVGGSIPNNGSLFVANERGAEVVANMGSRTGVMNTDQMEAAVANGMMKALAAGGQNVTVVLEGDASNFFTAMVRENNNAIMRVGASPLRV